MQSLNPACSHSGYDGLEVRGKKRFDLGDFFHQLHHRYFECNYGTAEMPWDRWFNSFHDGTPEATKRLQTQRKSTPSIGAVSRPTDMTRLITMGDAVIVRHLTVGDLIAAKAQWRFVERTATGAEEAIACEAVAIDRLRRSLRRTTHDKLFSNRSSMSHS